MWEYANFVYSFFVRKSLAKRRWKYFHNFACEWDETKTLQKTFENKVFLFSTLSRSRFFCVRISRTYAGLAIRTTHNFSHIFYLFSAIRVFKFRSVLSFDQKILILIYLVDRKPPKVDKGRFFYFIFRCNK